MQRMLVVLSLLAFATGACGCLEEIRLKPELSSVDLKKARAGSANLEVVWRFQECCPSGEQADIALGLQARIAELFEDVVNGDIELDRYNGLVRAAHNAIKEVILVCSAAGKDIHSDDPQLRSLGSPESVREAWQQCRSVLANIPE